MTVSSDIYYSVWFPMQTVRAFSLDNMACVVSKPIGLATERVPGKG